MFWMIRSEKGQSSPISGSNENLSPRGLLIVIRSKGRNVTLRHHATSSWFILLFSVCSIQWFCNLDTKKKWHQRRTPYHFLSFTSNLASSEKIHHTVWIVCVCFGMLILFQWFCFSLIIMWLACHLRIGYWHPSPSCEALQIPKLVLS